MEYESLTNNVYSQRLALFDMPSLKIHLFPVLVGDPCFNEKFGTKAVSFLELGLKVWIGVGVLLVPWTVITALGGALG
jgi:hypothetical protein